MKNKIFLTASEAAGFLGISTASIKNWERHGLLKAGISKNHPHPVYSQSDVETLLEQIRSGKINRLNRRANKKQTIGNILPEGSLKPACKTMTQLTIPVSQLMYLISLRLFIDKGLIKPLQTPILRKSDCQSGAVYSHFKTFHAEPAVLNEAFKTVMHLDLPNTSPSKVDTAGIIYQALSKRGDRSVSGSFYTPPATADFLTESALKQLIASGKRSAEVLMIDPCCGTGQFLLSFIKSGGEAINAYGIDSDPEAVFIGRTNILLECPDIETIPNIIHADSLLDNLQTLQHKTFDMAVTNPPWGACTSGKKRELELRYPEIKSGESFSYFINRCFNLVGNGGFVSAVLPESVTNVKRHKDVRGLILKHSAITDITSHGRIFKGVYTPVITMEMLKTHTLSSPKELSERFKTMPGCDSVKNGYKINPDFTFSINLNANDTKLIDRLYSVPHTTLENCAEWALGIVTGDNSKYIIDKNSPGSAISGTDYEPVVKGSDIFPGSIAPPQQFINFKPDLFQQTAPEWKYRASGKLVYRFISKKLVFAIDNSGMLTLNSANILIPSIETQFTAVEIMNLFNSELYNFIYRKRFNSVKVLRSHLEQLPLVNTDLIKGLYSSEELEYMADL